MSNGTFSSFPGRPAPRWRPFANAQSPIAWLSTTRSSLSPITTKRTTGHSQRKVARRWLKGDPVGKGEARPRDPFLDSVFAFGESGNVGRFRCQREQTHRAGYNLETISGTAPVNLAAAHFLCQRSGREISGGLCILRRQWAGPIRRSHGRSARLAEDRAGEVLLSERAADY